MRGERFSTGDEIRSVLSSLNDGKGGPVLHTDNGIKYVYTKEGHQLILGVSGSGKSRRGTIAQTRALIEAGESVICIDPKGELYKNTACYARESHKMRIVNFRNPAFSQRWSPLAFPKALYDRGEKGLAQQMVQEIVHNLTSHGNTSLDRFWIDSERNLLGGVLNLLIGYAPKENCNLAEILSILAQDWASLKKDDQNVSGGDLLDIVEALPPESPAKRLLTGYTGLSAKVTRSCVMAEVSNTISKFCSTEEVVAMTTGDELDIANMDADEPFIIYIIIPDESEIFNVLSGLLVSQISHRLIKLADSKYEGKLPVRTNFILEELGNIGHSVSDLPFLMSASRSRNVRMTLVLQALGQLETIYGKSKAETILSNADVWICFRTSDWNTLAELSRKCGEKKVQAGDIRFLQPLISEAQLMAMETGQALILISGRTKYIERFADYTELYNCGDLEEVPIPPAKEDDANRLISLAEMKNTILESKKNRALGSVYKKMLFKVGKGEE